MPAERKWCYFMRNIYTELADIDVVFLMMNMQSKFMMDNPHLSPHVKAVSLITTKFFETYLSIKRDKHISRRKYLNQSIVNIKKFREDYAISDPDLDSYVLGLVDFFFPYTDYNNKDLSREEMVKCFDKIFKKL